MRDVYRTARLKLSFISALKWLDRNSHLQRLRSRLGGNTVWYGLSVLRDRGFSPIGILDIGAYQGEWGLLASLLFPKARVLMIEAQPDMEPMLRKVSTIDPKRLAYRIALLGIKNSDAVAFFRTDDISTGSSVFEEQSETPRTQLHLPMWRLDDITEGQSFQLAKIDVQGAELEVLAGAAATLRHIELLVMELSLVEYNKGAPMFIEVADAVAKLGFSPFDICPLSRRNGVQLQADVIFLRSGSALRPVPPF
jgi:FkbM family methyltransferase